MRRPVVRVQKIAHYDDSRTILFPSSGTPTQVWSTSYSRHRRHQATALLRLLRHYLCFAMPTMEHRRQTTRLRGHRKVITLDDANRSSHKGRHTFHATRECQHTSRFFQTPYARISVATNPPKAAIRTKRLCRTAQDHVSSRSRRRHDSSAFNCTSNATGTIRPPARARPRRKFTPEKAYGGTPWHKVLRP